MTVVTEASVKNPVAEVARLITEVGPDVPEISRRMGRFKETVRYWYKCKIIDRGFAIQATANHEKLGLQRIVVVAQFADTYKEYAQSILTAMGELCYVTGFEKMLSEEAYLINASVPTEFMDAFIDFFSKLRERGLFTSTETFRFEYFRNPPMRAELYDFDKGRWDFDWSKPSTGTAEPRAYAPCQRESLDYTDLLVLKELQVDATRSMKKMADKLGVKYKTLAWHYQDHVVGRHLVKGYSVNWMGTRIEEKTGRVLHSEHRYLRVDVLAKDLNEDERLWLIAKANGLPFLWSNANGRDYWAQFAFPAEASFEAFRFIGEMTSPVRGKARHYVMDQTNALRFTIAHKLFDARVKRWAFDEARLLSQFDELLVKIKEHGQ